MRLRFWLGLGLVVISVNAMAATNVAALADFRLGQKYQAAKQWGPAAKAYLKVLKDDPKALWAYKYVGKVFYLAGHRKKSLAYYKRYLSYYPKDSATRKFTEKIKASLGQEQATPTQAAANTSSMPALGGGFSVHLEGSMLLNGGQDLADIYGSSYDFGDSGGMAASLGGGVDYAWPMGFVAGLDLLAGPNRAYALDFSGVGIAETVTWNFSSFTVLVTPGWRFKLNRITVEPRLGLGYMTSKVTITSSLGGSDDSASAAGLAIWPQLRAEYSLGKIGLGLKLGYLLAGLSPVKDEDGDLVQVFDSSGNASDWAIQNGGLSFGLYVTYHFKPPS